LFLDHGMERPNDGPVDHVGWALSTRHLGQILEQGVEHTHLNPPPIAAEGNVPLRMSVR
jgi:hypothetical protein